MVATEVEISTDPYTWIAVLSQHGGGSVTVPEVAPDGTILAGWGKVPSDELTAVAFGFHDTLHDGAWVPVLWVDRPPGGTLRVFRRRTVVHTFADGSTTPVGCALVAETTDAGGTVAYVSIRDGRVPIVTWNELSV